MYACSYRSLLLSNIVSLIYSEQQEVGGGHMLVPYLFTITQALSERSCLFCMQRGRNAGKDRNRGDEELQGWDAVDEEISSRL